MQRYALKLVLIGDSRVGKSQLSRSFVNKTFLDDAQVTVGIEFSTKVIEFDRSTIQTHIWDTAGQDRMQSMTKAYFRNCAGAVLVYDVCNRVSFDRLQTTWLKQLREQGYSDVRLILVGNKVDLLDSGKEREVSVAEAIEFARQENMDFFETSALTNYYVDHMFRRISLSVARTLPEVAVQMEVSYLPDGWMSCVDDSAEALNNSDISVSDVAAAMQEAPAVSSSPSSAKRGVFTPASGEKTKSPLAADILPLKYINYWTGETVRERPTSAAPLSDGILYVARETVSAEQDTFGGKLVDRGLKERTSSCKTTATFVSNSSAGTGGRSNSVDPENFDLHESRRSMSKSTTSHHSSAGGGGAVTRCLRSTCTVC